MSALMVGKQNPLHEVRRFMRQKDLTESYDVEVDREGLLEFRLYVVWVTYIPRGIQM